MLTRSLSYLAATLITVLLAACPSAVAAVSTEAAASTARDAVPMHATLAREPKVIAFGDSITWGVGADHPGRQSWPARVGAKRVASPGAAIAGPNGAVHRYRDLVLTQRPDKVIVAYGMNDLVWTSSADIVQAIRRVVRWNRRAGVQTYVATLTPLAAGFPWGLPPARADLNRLLRTEFPGRLIDFDATLTNARGSLPRRFDSGDGLHPNAKAYARMARAARTALALNPES